MILELLKSYFLVLSWLLVFYIKKLRGILHCYGRNFTTLRQLIACFLMFMIVCDASAIYVPTVWPFFDTKITKLPRKNNLIFKVNIMSHFEWNYGVLPSWHSDVVTTLWQRLSPTLLRHCHNVAATLPRHLALDF